MGLFDLRFWETMVVEGRISGKEISLSGRLKTCVSISFLLL